MNENGTEERFAKIGSLVRLRLASKVEEYTIVANGGSPKEGTVSIHSPLGNTLLGKKKRERVRVSTPGGERECEILEIF